MAAAAIFVITLSSPSWQGGIAGRARAGRSLARMDARVTERAIFSFGGAERARSLEYFERVDDQIMGGISQSSIVAAAGADGAAFRGVVRTDGGGFCGTRTRLFASPLDLRDFSGIYLRARGDGQRYKVNVRTAPEVGELVYQCSFLPPAGERAATVRIPFSAFRCVRRSTPVPDAPPLDARTIYQLGLVLSRFAQGEDDYNDAFRPGPFCLEIDEIGAYRDAALFASSVDPAPPPAEASLAAAPLSRGLELMPEGKVRRPRPRGPRALLFRLLGGRFRKKLRARVAARRSARAAQLLEQRKAGRTISELRRAELEPGPEKAD